MRVRLNRRTFLSASAFGMAAGTLDPSRLLGGRSGAVERSAALAATEPPTTSQSVHDRVDAVITRYEANLDSADFGVAPDVRTGLIYVSQRAGNNIAVFDRSQERFVAVIAVPTEASGPHNIRLDVASNSVWYAAGESSKIGRLLLDRRTRTPRNFVEYTAPGPAPRIAKPHSLAITGDGREVWFTDDRQEQVGFLNVETSELHVLTEHIEADGIMLEEESLATRQRSRRRLRRRSRSRRRRPRRRRPAPPAQLLRRVWVAGGSHVTVIDAPARSVVESVEIPREIGVSQLRLHDLALDRRNDRVWVLMRGGDGVAWLDRRKPRAGPQGYIGPAEGAAGLDHCDIGERYLWWTEGRSNHLTRMELKAPHEVVGYKVPVPVGYFNPHGVTVVRPWREVWFTERESICRLSFKDGRTP